MQRVNENAASRDDPGTALQESFQDDPSLAFFDCASLDALFFSEMLKGDDVESERERCRTGEEGMTSLSSGALYVMNQSDGLTLNSQHSSSERCETQEIGVVDTKDQNDKVGQYVSRDPDTAAANIKSHSRHQRTGVEPRSSLNLSSLVNSDGTIDDAQIASLQEDYRKGLMAAKILAQREEKVSSQDNLRGKGPSGVDEVLKSASDVDKTVAQSSLSETDYCRSDRQPVQRNPQIPASQLSTEQESDTSLLQLPSTEQADQSEQLERAASSAPTSSGSSEKCETSRLVLQFSSLASQLGINLPSHVIASLATATGKRSTSTKASDISDGQQSAALERRSMISTRQLPIGESGALSDAAVGSMSEEQCGRWSKKLISNMNGTLPSISSTTLEKTHSGPNTASLDVETSATSSLPDAGMLSYEPLLCNLNHSECEGENFALANLPNRKRKRQRLDECEVKLKALKEENRLLKRHLDNVLKKNQNLDIERAEAEQKMRKMLAAQNKIPNSEVSASDREELDRLVARFTELYSDYGKTRQQELKFHLHQLRKLATPTTFTKMSLWTLGQNEQFFSNPKRGSLGAILFRELEITRAQASKIVGRRHQVRSLSINIKKALDLLEELRVLCEGKQRIFHERMSKCQEVLSPVQVIKLLMWVDDNSQILECVCPGWGSERIKISATPGI